MHEEKPTRLHHQFAKLAPHPSPRKDGLTYLFVYSFEAPAAHAALGNLYIVIELPAADQSTRELCDILTESIGHYYYNSSDKSTTSERFEIALNQANKELKKLLSDDISQAIHGMSGLAAVVTPRQIIMGRAGGSNALLLRDSKLHTIFPTHSSKETANKIGFVDFANGDLENDDKILLFSPAIAIKLEQTKLIAILNQSNAALIIKNLAEALSSDDTKQRNGAIAVSIAEASTAITTPIPTDSAEIRTGDKPTPIKTAQMRLKPLGSSIVQKTNKMYHRGLKTTKTKIIPSTKHHSKKLWNGLWTKYINKNPRLAAAIVLAIVTVVIVTIFVFFKPHNVLTDQIETYKTVNSSYLVAQSQFADGNKAQANSKLIEIQPQIDSLNQLTDTQRLDNAVKKDKTIIEKLTVSQLLTKIRNLSDKTTGTVRVMPEKIFTASSKLVSTNLLGQTLYTLAENGQLYATETSNKNQKTFQTSIPATKVIASAIDTSTNRVYFLTSQPSVWQFDITSSRAIEVRLSSGDWPKAQDINFYNGALYVLSADSDQITKHFPTSIGFGPGSPYIKQNYADLGEMHALAINGSVFVSNAESKIQLFNLGVRQNFIVKDLPTNLGYATKLRISSSSTQISALNNNANRIFVISLSNDGATFKTQYAVDHIGPITSFSATDQQAQYYIATGNDLMRFKAE